MQDQQIGSTISHDIRASLQTLQLQLEIILLDKGISKESIAAATNAISEIQRLCELSDLVRSL